MIARNLKRQQRRSTATERLSGWVKPRKGMLRNKTKKPRRRRNLKEKSERESVLRKEDLELRRKELSQKEDMMKMLAQQQQQQTQLMLCLLAKGQNKKS